METCAESAHANRHEKTGATPESPKAQASAKASAAKRAASRDRRADVAAIARGRGLPGIDIHSLSPRRGAAWGGHERGATQHGGGGRASVPRRTGGSTLPSHFEGVSSFSADVHGMRISRTTNSLPLVTSWALLPCRAHADAFLAERELRLAFPCGGLEFDGALEVIVPTAVFLPDFTHKLVPARIRRINGGVL